MQILSYFHMYIGHILNWIFYLHNFYSILVYLSLYNQLVSQDVKLVLDWDSVNVLSMLVGRNTPLLLLIHVHSLRTSGVAGGRGTCSDRNTKGRYYYFLNTAGKCTPAMSPIHVDSVIPVWQSIPEHGSHLVTTTVQPVFTKHNSFLHGGGFQHLAKGVVCILHKLRL